MKGKAMHIESDRALYWQTMSNLTGHSVRYLRIRSAVRRALVWCPVLALIPLYANALTK